MLCPYNSSEKLLIVNSDRPPKTSLFPQQKPGFLEKPGFLKLPGANQLFSHTNNPSATSAYNTAANQPFSHANNPIVKK